MKLPSLFSRFIPGLRNSRANNKWRMAYDTASIKRRLAHWRPSNESSAAISAADGRILRDRARDLVRNNAYAASACESFVANLIGTGIKPAMVTDDDDLRKQVGQLWADWCEEADADGLTDFYGLQAMAARAMFDGGDCFIRLRSRRMDDVYTVPLQLQLLESDFCPYEYNETAVNGNRIVNGIEFDAIGRKIAYYFWRQHPGDIKIFGTMGAIPVRVPAEQVIHVFRPLRPGQVRGIPHLAPAMLKLWLLDSYDDAELERKRVAALFAGFIKSSEGVFDDDPPVVAGMPDDDATVPDAPSVTLEPGTLQQLLPGEEVTFSSPADVGGAYEMFQYRQLLSIASALGLPYAALCGDLKKANYSSSRGGIIEARRRISLVQHGVMVSQLCRPVRRRWMEDAVISGQLTLPDYLRQQTVYNRARWITPRSEWADPYKDNNAELITVRAGFKPLSFALEEQGFDAYEALEQTARDNKLLDKLQLSLDSDPRRVSRAGLTQARPAGSTVPDPLLEGSDRIDSGGDGAQNDNQSEDDAAANG